MRDKELIYRLLYLALVELRDRGRETKDKSVFRLADLFHNVPLELLRAADGGMTDEELLASLHERAARTGCSEWLKTRLAELEHKHAATKDGA